jgi:glycosyltransferase involved in cell wall biosynthesis
LTKVLWLSDAGCTTGFGRVTHSIGERLVEDYGHDVHVLAVNYRGDSWGCERPGHDHVTPLRLYRPNTIRQDDIWGMTRVIEMLGRVEPDVVVMLSDPQVMLNFLFKNQYDPEQILLRYRPTIAYVPNDGINLPRPWTTVLPEVTSVVAMSRWGQQAYQPSKLVYHGIDSELWWPISEKPKVTSSGEVCRTQADCKRVFGYDPDKFLVGRIDTNSARKDYPALVKALWPLMKKYKDIDVHFHCEDATTRDNGVRFQALFTREPDVDASRFHFPGLHNSFEGWPQQDVNVLLSAFDCFISTSRGEGFGLTLAEAAAVGVPIVAQNVSAIPEVVGPGGILLEPKDTFTVPSGEDVWLPDIPAFTAAIERLYHSKGLRRDLGTAGVEHARKSFSWDFAAQKFDEYITALEHYEPPVPSTEASEASA